jgi:hypothetical protein
MARLQRIEYAELTPTLREIVTPDMLPAKRIAMARGLVPLGSRDLLLALYYLAGDKDPDVAKEAQQSLRELPESLTLIGISGAANPKLLHFVANRPYDNHHIHERVALHQNVTDATLAEMAETAAHDRVIEAIAGNERAILRSPAILFGLTRNPNTPQSAIDRLTKFYAIEKGRPFTADLSSEMLARPPARRAVAPTPPPLDAAAAERLLSVPDEDLHRCVRLPDLATADFDIEGLFADDLTAEPETALEEAKKVPLLRRIARMTIVDRILLARRGNSETRQILIRNPNKLIQESVLENPRITVGEIVHVIKERTTPQAILEKVARNREWLRNYDVTRSLCFNPKAPMRFVFRHISILASADLKRLGMSRNVAGFTRQMARNLLEQRGSRL